MLRRSPFTVLHVLVVVMGALAYTSFSNLAILVRQRSLLMPSLLFLLCLPPLTSHRPTIIPQPTNRQPALPPMRQPVRQQQ